MTNTTQRIRGGLTAVAAVLALQLSLSAAPIPTQSASQTTDQTMNNQSEKHSMMPSNSDITMAVQDAILFDSSVSSYGIDVKNNQGEVTLTGTVDNLRARDRAVRIAQTVKGVRAVIDRMNVAPSDRTDDEIRQEVNNALLYDPAADSYEVNPVVVNGEVTLNGSVDSWQERELAIDVVKGVRGVRSVEDNLVINYDGDRADSEIRPEVQGALEHDVLVDATFIDVTVRDGRVSLSGSTGSAAEVERARIDSWVKGVKAVDVSGLTVDAWRETPDRQETPMVKSDEDIKKAVEDAFLYDPRVYSFNPDVSVNAGVVRLSGTVDNLKAKQAAERDARNTVGVWRVKNYLQVRPQAPISDTLIEQQIRSSLAFNPLLDAGEVHVSSRHGLVTLTGDVDSFVEKSEAEDVAMRTNGVVAVTNALDVRNPWLTSYMWDYQPFYSAGPDVTSWPYRSDAEIKDDIQDELFWSPFVDSDEVSVQVENGVATLNGTVDTWYEFRAAGENAIEGGAISVINNLDVR